MRYIRFLVVFCCLIIALNVSYLYLIRKSSSPVQLQEKFQILQAAFKVQGVDVFQNAGAQSVTPFIDPKDNPNFAPVLFQKNLAPGFVLGAGRKEKVSLVIGVPTVKREGVSYLYTSLNSLVRCIYPNEEEKVSIVVFIAETDEEYVREEANKIYGNFTREVDSGLLQVVGPPKDFYPDFDQVPDNLGDDSTRVRWRSKEVLDAALAMHYCRHKADYYVMTEDDAVVSYGYTSAIREFAKDHDHENYSFLSFSTLGSIGKVFRARDIGMWFSYFITFYNQKPIDWLMHDLVNFINCNDGIPRPLCLVRASQAVVEMPYSIFQHIGKTSSLVGKVQNLESSMFREHVPLAIRHKNPVAKILSNVGSAPLSDVESWYADDGGMTKSLLVTNMKENEAITFLFDSPLVESWIFIRTGSVYPYNDKRACQKCVSIEILHAGRESKDNDLEKVYKPCADSDINGNIECKTSVPVASLRIKANRNIYSDIWFDFIYVGPRKSTLFDATSPPAAYNAIKQ